MFDPNPPQFKFKNKILDREAEKECYKHRIMLQDDVYFLEALLLDKQIDPLPTWPHKDLQGALNYIAEKLDLIKAWPRTELHDVIDQVFGRNEEDGPNG